MSNTSKLCPFCGNKMGVYNVVDQDNNDCIGMISFCDWCGFMRKVEDSGWSLGIINQREWQREGRRQDIF